VPRLGEVLVVLVVEVLVLVQPSVQHPYP